MVGNEFEDIVFDIRKTVLVYIYDKTDIDVII